MKRFLILWSCLVMVYHAPLAFAQTQKAEDVFTATGRLTQMDPDEKILRLRTEAGLEFTFRVVATTQIQEGGALKLFSDLAINEPVQIEYTYNEDFEKVARLIRKEQVPASS